MICKWNFFVKRAIDICGSFVGLILLSPLFLIIAILIKSSSEGAVFFKQKRLGKNGKAFWIYKFRTMVENAENIGAGLFIDSEKDPRITYIGSILRNTSLDELPQLINVLTGDMSLVGPRPPVVYHPYDGYENYPQWAKKRFFMRPGITGLAQVSGRNAITWDDRIKIDNEYIDTFNILVDIQILFQTIQCIMKKRGVYTL